MCKIIAIANQKGGVGKTTTAINLSIGIANKGYKVLVIDDDPQGSLTASLGWKPDKLNYCLSDVMAAIIEKTEIPNAILRHKEGIDVLPANIQLSGLELTLVSLISRETVLKRYINTIKDNYDYIIIDCQPSLGLLTINSLVACHKVIIPTKADETSISGVTAFLNTVNMIKENFLNEELQVKGILITMLDRRANYPKKIIEQYNTLPILNTKIPMSIKAAELSSAGCSIYTHSKNCTVAEAYRKLTIEIVEGD